MGSTLKVLVFVLYLGSPALMSQMSSSQDLIDWRERQQHLLHKNPQSTFIEARQLEKEAHKSKNHLQELIAIDTQCTYFKVSNDFDKMLNKAQELLLKSQEYKSKTFEIIARKHLFEALTFSGLIEKGYEDLQKATLLLSELDDSNDFELITKSDIYIAHSNYHIYKKDYLNQFKFIKLSGKYFEKISNQSLRDKLLYIHHCNLAGPYLQLGKPDSAVYYAKLSLSQENNYDRADIQFNNYSNLGNIAFDAKNYELALENYLQAENTKGYKNHLNAKQLYEKIIEIYHSQGDLQKVNQYKLKLDSLQLIITQNQNKSLHTLLKEKEKSQNNSPTSKYFFALAILLFIGLFALYFIKKSRKEKVKKETNLSEKEFVKLFELIKKNDPGFMFYFDEKFDGFTQKLLKINPNLSTSELEICALMKLNISTKNIARYKYIAPKTVQNKKSIIRKKLNIASDVDLNKWFYNF